MKKKKKKKENEFSKAGFGFSSKGTRQKVLKISPMSWIHFKLSAGKISQNPLGRIGHSVRAECSTIPGFCFRWPGSSSGDFQRYPTLYSKFITFNYLQNDGLLRPKLNTEQNGAPGTQTLTVCGETSRTPNLDFLESKMLRISSSS